MAAKQRAIELLVSGKLASNFSPTIQKAQTGINKYRRALTGVASSERAASAARAASMGSLMRTVAGYAGAYIGAQQLARGIWGSVKEYDNQIKMENRLFQLMSNVKGVTREQIVAMKAYASQLQAVTTIGDDVNLMGASQLSTFQLQAGSIRKLLPALQDLAVGQHGISVNQQQMQQSANLLGKVFTGQAGALRRAGVNFDKTQESILKTGTEAEKTAMLIKVINQNYGGLARRMAATPEGRMIQLANAWGDVKERIGKAFSPYVLNAIGYVTKNLPAIQAVVDRMVVGGKKLIEALTPTARVVYNIGKWIVTNWRLVAPIVVGITTAVTAWRAAIAYLTVAQMALNLAMNLNPIGITITAIGVMIGLIAALVLNWDKVKTALIGAYNWFVKFATEGPGRFIPFIGLIGQIAKNWDAVKASLKAVWDWGKKVYDTFAKILDKWKQLVTQAANSKVGRAALNAVGAGGMIPGRASGGPVSAGSPYIVGERGPELFVPKRSGGIVPNNQLAMAGVGPLNFTVTINGNASANDVRNGITMAVKDFERMLNQVLHDRSRRSLG